jgi:anti-sigma B factor antagonist
MEMSIEKVGNVTHAICVGESLDASTVKNFKKHMSPILDQETRVVLGLENVKFVDSSGLGALLYCLRVLRARDGDIKLYGMTKQVSALFKLVRMQRIFDIFDSAEEAIEAFG